MADNKPTNNGDALDLFHDVCQIIDGVRTRVAVYVNSEVCLTNWHIGKRIKEDVLFNQRAEYGKQVLKTLSAKLTERYGRGWGFQTLQHCVRAAYTFSEEEIVYAVRRQFTWTHLRSLMSIDDPLKRRFYMEWPSTTPNCLTRNYWPRNFSGLLPSLANIVLKITNTTKNERNNALTNNKLTN